MATHFTGEKANYPTPAQNGENGEELNIPGNLPGKLQLSLNTASFIYSFDTTQSMSTSGAEDVTTDTNFALLLSESITIM